MKFIAEIDIMPHANLLDPQGKAVGAALKNLELNSVHEVRMGKHATLHLEAASADEATAIAEAACKKILCNPIVEFFRITVSAD